MEYNVVETFTSINGEGARAGELAFFIRLRGCNLRCSYCDTAWAQTDSAPARTLSGEELCRLAGGVTNVTVTGGEPMLNDLAPLCKALIARGHRVEIETNGSVALNALCAAVRPSFTMDYKLPSSRMENEMCVENFALLGEDDTVKFVAGSREDLKRALEIMERYSLRGRCRVYISPVFGTIEPAEIVEFMKDNGLNDVRVQLQLHKYIWDPQKRGV